MKKVLCCLFASALNPYQPFKRNHNFIHFGWNNGIAGDVITDAVHGNYVPAYKVTWPPFYPLVTESYITKAIKTHMPVKNLGNKTEVTVRSIHSFVYVYF